MTHQEHHVATHRPGIPVASRRECLRRLAGVVCATLLWEPLPGWTAPVEPPSAEILRRHPWLTPWVQQDGMDPQWPQAVLGELTPDARVIGLMDHQAEARPYHEYRARVLNDHRIRKGRRMMKKHRAILDKVTSHYPVPPEVVVALWGMESDFGDGMGQFNVLRTLYTLAAHYPRRADFFRSELHEFLLLCQEERWDPRKPKGSYAGAMGQVQMMPGTLRRFAVDFNLDGRRDVVRDVTDSLASIAAFLHGNDWRPGQRMAQPLEPQAGLAERFATWAKTRKSWREWRALGISWPAGSPEPDLDEPLELIILEESQGPRYYMTFMNFWVIIQWNRSSRFAMTVREFALALRNLE
ncbi:MAG: lytic murein transglycosylase [Magnetococcales bacterium]|nr:lytic murein transglycosylase [Magnetococcales bacterium]